MTSRIKVLRYRKAQLVRQIEAERTALKATAAEWRRSTESIDQGWQFLQRYKAILLSTVGVLALKNLRHPSRLIKWSRRAVSLFSSYLLLRKAAARLRD